MTVPRNGCKQSMDRKYFHKCKSYLVNAMGILKDIYRVDDFELFYKKKKREVTFALQICHSR